MDAMTRSAVKKCESKYPGATDARSMLGAMHIGFENGNQAPTMAVARSGSGGSMGAGGTTESMMDSTGHMRHGMNRMRNDSSERHMRDGMRDGMRGTMRDSAGRKMMRRNGMRDSTMRMRGRDTTHSQGMGGMVDSNKSTPMAPAAKDPMSPMTNPRNSSTMSQDSPSMKRDTMSKHDTMPKPI
jgi:hypothetical protein